MDIQSRVIQNIQTESRMFSLFEVLYRDETNEGFNIDEHIDKLLQKFLSPTTVDIRLPEKGYIRFNLSDVFQGLPEYLDHSLVFYKNFSYDSVYTLMIIRDNITEVSINIHQFDNTSPVKKIINWQPDSYLYKKITVAAILAIRYKIEQIYGCKQ